jgi:hypothetical protein
MPAAATDHAKVVGACGDGKAEPGHHPPPGVMVDEG